MAVDQELGNGSRGGRYLCSSTAQQYLSHFIFLGLDNVTTLLDFTFPYFDNLGESAYKEVVQYSMFHIFHIAQSEKLQYSENLGEIRQSDQHHIFLFSPLNLRRKGKKKRKKNQKHQSRQHPASKQKVCEQGQHLFFKPQFPLMTAFQRSE